MKRIFTLLFLSAYVYSSAQNLVPNPSFDVQDSCPAVSELFVCKPWKTPTLGTPDAFNSTCATQNGTGHTGVGSSGIYMYSVFPDNREYMQVALTSALTGGQVYYVSFWVQRETFRYAVNRVGAYFSVGAVNDMSTTSVLPYLPQVENPSSRMLSSSAWVNILGSFTASGGEDHMVIGNFSNDSQTDTLVVTSSQPSKIAYYNIDDVSVTASGNSVNEIYGNESRISAFPNPSAGKIHLEGEILKGSEIKIYNSIGDVVYQSSLSAGKSDIDISNSPKGIYFLRMNSEEGSVAKKLVIE